MRFGKHRRDWLWLLSPVAVVVLPNDWNMDEIALSLAEDRLAWKLYASPRSHIGLLAVLLQRLFPEGWQPRLVVGLWVSRLDGSGMHEIGELAAPRQEAWNATLSDLSWMPDGKRLSFTGKGALWTIPVN